MLSRALTRTNRPGSRHPITWGPNVQARRPAKTMIHAGRSRQGPVSMSAPLPQGRTDLNAMFKFVRAASRLRAVRCIPITRTAERGIAMAGDRPKARACPSALMLSSKLSRCKGARDNALYNDEGCDRITLEHAQSVASLAFGGCCLARNCRSRACTCAEHRRRSVRPTRHNSTRRARYGLIWPRTHQRSQPWKGRVSRRWTRSRPRCKASAARSDVAARAERRAASIGPNLLRKRTSKRRTWSSSR
jgi:hypothetical protein